MSAYTLSELEAYLDEALSPEEMAAVEAALREDETLAEQLAAVLHRRDAGVHSIGAIWRRNRASCPSREQWGAYLLGTLEDELQSYMQFHLETVGCRLCQANLEDLQQRQKGSPEDQQRRSRKYYQTSSAHLRQEKS